MFILHTCRRAVRILRVRRRIVRQKYNTPAAELWRDKVKCESEGRPWDPSTAKVSSSSMYRAKENRSSPALLQGHDEPSTKSNLSARDTSSNHSYSSNSYNNISNQSSYNGGGNNGGGVGGTGQKPVIGVDDWNYTESIGSTELWGNET